MAYALMLQAMVGDALALYPRHVGKKVFPKVLRGQAVRDDVTELRGTGLSKPIAREIEASLSCSEDHRNEVAVQDADNL